MIRYTDFCFGVALSALLICFGNLAFTILDGHTRKPQNRIYMSLLMLLAVNAVCEMINVPEVVAQLVGNGLDKVVYLLFRTAEFFEFHRQFFPIFRVSPFSVM